MFIQVERTYTGGMLVVMDVPTVNGESQISVEDAALIAQYVQLLNEKNILGDIDVTFSEIKQKFES
jgi:hypothetical protein